MLLCCHLTEGHRAPAFYPALSSSPFPANATQAGISSTAVFFLTFHLCLMLQDVSVGCEAQGGGWL